MRKKKKRYTYATESIINQVKENKYLLVVKIKYINVSLISEV